MKEYFVRPVDDLQSVLDHAEPGSLVQLAAGEYRQKLQIRTPRLTLRGAGCEKTVLIWDDYARKLDEQGREYNTFRTWTVAVTADGVQMLAPSAISMTLTDGTVWGGKAQLVKAIRKSYDRTFDTPVYKKASVRDRYNELTLRYKAFDLVFRAYNEGVAYRFVSRIDKRVGVQEGSVSQGVLGNTGITVEQLTYYNLNDAFDALSAGEVDFVLCDAYPGAFLASTYADVSFAGALNEPSSWGIAVATGKVDLQEAVGDALDAITLDGRMDVVRVSWLGGMPAVTSDQVIVETTTQSVPEDDAETLDGSEAGANAVSVG